MRKLTVGIQLRQLTAEYRATYLSAAARLMDELEDLPILHVDSQQDEKIRTQLTIHLLAGFETAFYRLRPET